jgi:hypothetical protein
MARRVAALQGRPVVACASRLAGKMAFSTKKMIWADLRPLFVGDFDAVGHFKILQTGSVFAR